MDDERLKLELERRANQGVAPDLLSAVSPRLTEVRPQPARVARWAPLAGLAAAAIIVLALAVALPGITPSNSSPPSIAAGQPSLDVMSTGAFASALRRGALADRIVLVSGGIVGYDGPVIFGGYCGPNGPACLLGQLSGIDPRVVIFGPDIAVASSAGSSVNESSGWPWWNRVAPPIQGILMLSVDQTGGVEYVGRVVPNGEQLSWFAGQVKNLLDVTARDLDEVVLVNGWLTGLDVPASCSAPGPSPIAGLPQRFGCGRMSWLADEPAVIDPQSQAPPASAIQVQLLAYGTYAPDPSARAGVSLAPQRAVYAIARRLYGQGCIDPSAPCWGWSVVGRLSQSAPELAPPSLQLVPTPEIAPTPTAVALATGQQLSCGTDWGLVCNVPEGPERLAAIRSQL